MMLTHYFQISFINKNFEILSKIFYSLKLLIFLGYLNKKFGIYLKLFNVK